MTTLEEINYKLTLNYISKFIGSLEFTKYFDESSDTFINRSKNIIIEFLNHLKNKKSLTDFKIFLTNTNNIDMISFFNEICINEKRLLFEFRIPYKIDYKLK